MNDTQDDPIAADDPMRVVIDELRGPTPVDHIDLLPGLRAKLDARPPRSRALLPVVLGAVAVCAAALFLVQRAPRPGDADDEGFRAKGAGVSDDDLVGLEVYRQQGGALVPVDATIAPDAALGFTVTNLAGFKYLMVFAVDASGEVRWYAPAWTDPATNPTSVAAPQGAAKPLPDVVTHALAPGAMGVFALLTDEPLHVADVERWHPTAQGVHVETTARHALAQLSLEVRR